MILPLLVLAFLVSLVSAAGTARVDLVMGSYKLSVLYDPAKAFPSRVMHVMTEGSTLYAVGVDDGVSDKLVCWRVVTKEVIANPRGCDAKSPTEALVDYFCEFSGELALSSARSFMYSQWSLRADSPECVDESACHGPVYVSSESWRPEDVITDLDLITSKRGVFVVSNAGPAGEIPMVTFIPIVMPRIAFWSDSCSSGFDDPEGFQFEMSAKDNYEAAYTNSTYTYGVGVSARMRFEREGRGKFRVMLGTKGGGSSFYNDDWASVNTYHAVSDVLEKRVTFYSVANTSATCRAELTLVAAPRPLELIPPQVPDDLTYYLDRRDVYTTTECSLRRGALDENNNLVYPELPRNGLGGGLIRFRAPGPFGQKYRVEPHAEFKDFDWSCTKFWPRSNEFTGIRGSAAVRDMPHLLACSAPFPHPKRVVDTDYDVFEKLRQCKMLGGRGALESVDYCVMDVTTTMCRKGWFFFDEFCYYRPNPDTDSMTRQADADAACSALHPKAKAAAAIDEYTEAWLQSNFVFQNAGACGTSPVRALVSGTRCKCYDCTTSGFDNVTISSEVTECGCESLTYPLCVYKIKDDYIAWNDMRFHPATLQTLKDGQCMDKTDDSSCMGNERYGKELECECIPGSAGQYCDRRACIVNASTLVGDGLLLKFAQVCEKHGFCDEGQVDVCGCERGYGPTSEFGDEHTAHPCALPSVTETANKTCVIDGATYSDCGVCNGEGAGEGICDPTTGICRCACRQRRNMDPDGEGLEPAFDSHTCSARTPMLPANGYQNNGGIVERLCNGRGTACPSGERLGERRLDGTYLVTVDSDGCRGKPDGCVCDNGFTGHACTMPVPFDEAARKPTYFDHGAYVPIRGGRHPVMNVMVRPERAYAGVVPTCDVTSAYVSDTVLKSESNCTRTEDEERWWCAGSEGTYVVVTTVQENPSCSIEVYTENHAPCGNYTDARMARRFANEVYRDWNRTDEFQSLTYARHGGSTTECACDADHTGPLCMYRVTSKRYDSDGVASNRVCGEGTQPPRGKPGLKGCEYFVIAGLDFSKSESGACATVGGEMCGGVGTCLESRMNRGRCVFDELDEANDDLASPFTPIAPPLVSKLSTYVVTERSVMEFEGRSWLVNEGQTFAIESVRGNVSICHDNARYPLNVTHECGQPVDVAGPVRAVANVSVVTYEWSCVEYEGCAWVRSSYLATCDPAFSCPTTRFCVADHPEFPSPCLEVHEWTQDTTKPQVLVSKRYVGTRATCAYLSPKTSQIDVDLPYGVFPTCSNPVYRWLDAALEGARFVATRQCTEGIGPHDNVRGQIYGVFDNVVPGLNFRLAQWTDAHYAFVASIMNSEVCVDSAGKYVDDALTDAVVDAYGIQLVVAAGAEEAVALGELGTGVLLPGDFSPNLTMDVPGAWWGNPYWHVGNPEPFGPTTRWGGWVLLPEGQGEVRKVTIRNSANVSISAISLVGPKGEVCVTRLEELRPNETFTVDCGAAFESEPHALSLRRLWEANLTGLAANMTAWPSPYVMLYSAASGPVAWRETDVAYTTRSTSYVEKWRSISASIITRRTFPPNQAFRDECARLGGFTRDVDIAKDRAFLKDVHDVVLGRPECTHDWQCKRFARGPDYRCVPDPTLPSSGWANGDPTKQEVVPGSFEGGCYFGGSKSIMDPQFHGSRCEAGYEASVRDALDFETEASARMRSVPGWTEPFVLMNVTEFEGMPKCVLPSGSSVGRPTEACGGARGRLRRSTYVVDRNLTVFAGTVAKRCVAVEVGGETLEAHSGETELDIHSFGGFRVNVIKGEVYVDGELVADPPRCVERTSSATHRSITTTNGGNSLLTTRRDDWTYFIV